VVQDSRPLCFVALIFTCSCFEAHLSALRPLELEAAGDEWARVSSARRRGTDVERAGFGDAATGSKVWVSVVA